MDAERRQEIRDALEAATSGPWNVSERWPELVEFADGAVCECVTGADETIEQAQADAHLIASAPTFIAELLEDNERLEGERDEALAGFMADRAPRANGPVFFMPPWVASNWVKMTEDLDAANAEVARLRAVVEAVRAALKKADDSMVSSNEILDILTEDLEAALGTPEEEG